MIKDVTTEDLIEFSKSKDYVGLSSMVAKAFFGIRTQNLHQIVKYTRRKYERELLPQAEYKIHRDLKDALIDTGIIRQYLEYRENNEYEERTDEENKAKKRLGLREEELDLRNHARTINLSEKRNTKLKERVKYARRLRFERKVCHKFMKMHKDQPERIEEIYENCIKAVESITREDVGIAVKSMGEYGEIVLSKDSDILPEQRIKKIQQVVEDIKRTYPEGFNDEDIEIYIENLIERRKEDKKELFASAFALEYVAGMADTTLLEASLLKGYMNVIQLIIGNKRGAKAEDAVDKMGKEWEDDNSGITALESALSEKEER